MTKDVDIVDTEFAGAMKVRIVDVDIDNYDSDAAGDGESFNPSDAGMHRFQHVTTTVKYGEGSAVTVQNCVAEYDWANQSIRLLQQSDSGGTDADAELVEVPSNASEGAMVRALCYGR